MAATVQMTMKARAMRAAGTEVIALTIGEPDFDSPAHAIEAGYQAALRGETKYPPQDGVPALKGAIQRKFKRDAGLEFGLDEIMVANGGKQVIFDALMATVDPGDEVIVPAPYWGAYPLMTKVVGGEPVVVACPQNNQFRLRPEDLEAAITPRTKWVMLNSPNNPTGSLLTTADLQALGEVLLRYPQVWVMSDDMYEHLVFEGRHATMAAAVPALRDRVLTVSGGFEDVCDDGVADWVRGGAAGVDQGDGDDAGACVGGGVDGGAGGGGGGAGWAAGGGAGDAGGLQAAAGFGGGGAEPGAGDAVPPAGGGVLCVSERGRVLGEGDGGGASAGDGRGFRAGAAGGAACGGGAWAGVWDVAVFADQLRDGGCGADGGLRADRGVLRGVAVGAPSWTRRACVFRGRRRCLRWRRVRPCCGP